MISLLGYVSTPDNLISIKRVTAVGDRRGSAIGCCSVPAFSEFKD